MRSRVFALQRDVAGDAHEPLMAVLPGVALGELWQIVSIGEKGLLLMYALIVVVGLAGLASSIPAALGERRRELALLRVVGARPVDLLLLLAMEGILLMPAGTFAGYLLLTALGIALAPWLEGSLGVALPVAWPHASEFPLLAAIIAAGAIEGCIHLAPERGQLRRVVAMHRATNPRVFGSVVHGNDTEGSDLDPLIDPTPDTTLLDIGAIRHELLQLLGVPVDVLTPKALPEKFRATVLAEATPV